VVGLTRSVPPTGAPDSDRLSWVTAELADSVSVKSAVADCQRKLGGAPQAFLHCAGGFRWKPISETTNEELDFLLSANLKSSVLLLRELIPGMRAAGFGRIVMIGARSALAPGAGVSVYAATKAGVHALVSSVADEVRDTDITINAVLPTVMDTPANRKDMPAADPGKWVSLEEMAEVLAFLCGPHGRPIHGALIPVAGRL
jgi:NAD(P)-dependent dehydrogenase (short-subunit alcohol dehydrogenase family)